MTSYKGDFAKWGEEQAAARRAGRFDALDLEHLAEEIEGLVRSDRRALASQLERIILHLLKWEFQPERRGKSWRLSIAQGRDAVADLLEESPSLRREIAGLIGKAYERGRRQAVAETDLPSAQFPKICPYTPDAILRDAGLGEVGADE